MCFDLFMNLISNLWPKRAQDISPTIIAMTKLFVLFCSAQDDESADINCLVFRGQCQNGKILMKRQVYIIRGFLPILGVLSQYEMLISFECTVDSE